MNFIYILGLVFVISLTCGYVIFILILKSIPKKLHLNNIAQKQKIINEAKAKLESLKAEEENLLSLKIQMMNEELDSLTKENIEKLQNRDEELTEKEIFLQEEEQRINKLEENLSLHKEKVHALINTYNTTLSELKRLQSNIATKIEELTGKKFEYLKEECKNNIIENYKIEQSRDLKLILDEIATSAKKEAQRILSKTIAKYGLDFIWPKMLTHIEIKNPVMFEMFFDNKENSIIHFFKELAKEVEIEAIPPSDDDLPFIKLSGGYGIDREALKLTIERILDSSNKKIKTKEIEDIFIKYKLDLEQKAQVLGSEAIKLLKIENIHPELQKMIGSLYWRTSYRQNQYYHSIEVATFCGILAEELGLDSKIAKQCGILHDIGKSLDYKIEGSHAIISADYADRYGISLEVCNIILAHHDDIKFEHPLTHVLIAADTISGARPGSRLNLEEGYQERLASIHQVIQKFPMITKVEIMYGAREVHVEVSPNIENDEELKKLSSQIARKIEEEVSYPGQIKIILTRKFEVTAIA